MSELVRKWFGGVAPVRAVRTSMAKGLNLDEESRREHVEGMRCAVEDEATEKIHNWLHTNLIILDSKAQGLLALYSIALAAVAILYAGLDDSAPMPVVVLFVLTFASLAWAVVPLAKISFVYWNTTDEFLDTETLLMDLLRVRDARTIIVRRSVMKGGVALILFAILLAWDVARRLAA